MNSLSQQTGSLGLRIVSITATAALMLSVSQAAQVTLSDQGSTALIDLDSEAGMYQWNVQNYGNQLNQQWFWYRIGNSVPQPINTISAASYDVNHPANSVAATYNNGQIEVTINYTLTGGGIGQADISEGITLRNLTSTPFDFHFYQYSDFNLLGSALGDSVNLDTSYVVQWKGDTQIAEAIVAPDANRFEANTTGGTSSTLYKLNNTQDLNLLGPDDLSADGAEGDVTWAYQWDFNIAAGQTETIGKDKLLSITLVPEPSTAALLALGLGILGRIRRRRH